VGAAVRPARRLRRLGAASFAAVLLTLAAASPTGAGVPAVREDASDRATYDPYFSQQWALTAIGAPWAWTRSVGEGVRVGIVDTGVDLHHEDLAGKVVASAACIGARSAAACGGSAQDDDGHGTLVAGIIAADTANGRGVAGVAPGALLVVAKALDAEGSGTVVNVASAIRWVVDHGARVVNLSLQADGAALSGPPGEVLVDAVEYAWRHGAIPVIAAGNTAPSVFGARGYGGLDAVIVGATGRSGELAWYSGSLAGARWAVVAPGGDARGPAGTASCAAALAVDCIVSTGWFPGRANAYAVDEGTSMAAAAVSGVLALLLARGLSPAAAVDRLLATADPSPCGAGCAGAVDAARAVGAAAVGPGAAGAAVVGPATARLAAVPRAPAAGWRLAAGVGVLVALAGLCLRGAAARSRPSRRS